MRGDFLQCNYNWSVFACFHLLVKLLYILDNYNFLARNV